MVLNMRTLATQMRLRRALRAAAEYEQRLGAERSRPLMATASVRLVQLVRDARTSWHRESAGAELGSLQSFVNRSLSAMEVAAAGLAQPGADPASLTADLRRVGVPLVFCLRGLDDTQAAVLDELTGRSLLRTA